MTQFLSSQKYTPVSLKLADSIPRSFDSPTSFLMLHLHCRTPCSENANYNTGCHIMFVLLLYTHVSGFQFHFVHAVSIV